MKRKFKGDFLIINLLTHLCERRVSRDNKIKAQRAYKFIIIACLQILWEMFIKMLRVFLRSKIHMATVTESNITYEGSITIDSELMEMVGILPFEQVMISNMNNGERFETYVIPGKAGSREVCLNGPTARKGIVGDRIIIFSYCLLSEDEIVGFSPKIIKLDKSNNPLL